MATKKLNNITCGLSTSAGNLLTFFFAVCNNRPVRVIGRAGKRPEITVVVCTIVVIMIFSLGAMSFGSISYETHTTLATAMNKWVVVCFDSFKFLRQSGFVDLLVCIDWCIVCIECNWSHSNRRKVVFQTLVKSPTQTLYTHSGENTFPYLEADTIYQKLVQTFFFFQKSLYVHALLISLNV